jgi:NIMA (never in mitosis gene a)-related kinase
LVHAVGYAHQNKIIHRDLKGANVFLDTSNGFRVKLGDFGLSRQLNSEAEMAKTIAGTPLYTSPEQVALRDYNNMIDMWALGCILHELCALDYAFTAINVDKLNFLISHGMYSRIPK